MAVNDWCNWQDGRNRPRETVKDLKAEKLEPTQPIKVQEFEADTATVAQIRESALRNKQEGR